VPSTVGTGTVAPNSVHAGGRVCRQTYGRLVTEGEADPDVFHLADLTSPEAAQIAARRSVIGLIPLGAVEQHGPHLPLATDAIIAEYLAHHVAARLSSPVVVAPVVAGGMSWHHLGFPGTVHLDKETFAGCIRAYLDTFTRLGVRRIAIFSAHGGNFALLHEMMGNWSSECQVQLTAYTDLPRYLCVMAEAAAKAGLIVPPTDAHAGGLETSQMMFLLGEDRIQIPDDLSGCYVEAESGWLERLLNEGVDALSPIGVVGMPKGASSSVGEAICQSLVDELVVWIEESLA